MKFETWMPVVGYEGLYEVSDFGRVRSLDRTDTRGHRIKGRVLRPNPVGAGHLQVTLWSGKRTVLFVHRLVLAAFVGPCPLGMETCHGDGNPANNMLTNLRWDTREANEADKTSHGTRPTGERHTNSKLKAVDIERIFDLRRSGCTQQKIADWLHIHQTHVSRIISGKAWSFVTDS